MSILKRPSELGHPASGSSSALKPVKAGVKKTPALPSVSKMAGAKRGTPPAPTKAAAAAATSTSTAATAAANNNNNNDSSAASARAVTPASVSPTTTTTKGRKTPAKKPVNVFAAPARRKRVTAKSRAEAAEKKMLFAVSALKDQKSAFEVERDARDAARRAAKSASR